MGIPDKERKGKGMVRRADGSGGGIQNGGRPRQ